MSLTLSWQQIALRLALASVAGALIGFNRGEHGHPAGLRTTLLVCLAAAVAMIQVNLLMPISGKTPSSFAVFDLMRLPLGILSGMGFIGAGAILRKGEVVHGVTTAATLWFVTVIGLCFGGGQVGLGLAGLIMGLVVLWGMKWIENRMKQERQAVFVIATRGDSPTEEKIHQLFQDEGYRIRTSAITYHPTDQRREISCAVVCRSAPIHASRRPQFIDRISKDPDILRVEWRP